MFSPDHLDFHFPLFITCLHMIVQFSLAALVLYFVPRFRPHHESFPDPATGSARTNGQADAEKPLITKNFYLTRIGPCGAATGLDIGLGNMSLKFISLTFYSKIRRRPLGPAPLTTHQQCANRQRSPLSSSLHSSSVSRLHRGSSFSSSSP